MKVTKVVIIKQRLILERNRGACAPNSEEEASVTDFEEDASNEDSGEDAEDTKEMEVSSNNESDEMGNYQTEVDIRT